MDFLLEGLLTGLGLLVALDPATFSAVKATLASSFLSLAVALLLGAPLGFLLGWCDFRGRRTLRLLTDTMLSFPTVVIGLVVYAFLSRKGPFGDAELLFTIPGMAIGLAILGLPLVVALTAQSVESLDERFRETVRTLGATPFQAARTALYEARFGVMLAAVTAFGRVASEVGISMMVGGNIKWQTRTITTAIALETNKGQFGMGVALGIVLLAIALVVNLGVAGLKRRVRL